ncbi:MAG: FtsW/RodA/SpoVE family cell cycle protein [Eubacterium sp.]|nr:FtsW/RodA/SpoVE family cell cycle protein [Eubacterium sp.]
MEHIITELSKYLLIIFFAIYTFQCFHVFKGRKTQEHMDVIYGRQTFLMFLIHLVGNILIIMNEKELKYIVFYLAQLALMIVFLVLYTKIYKKASRLVVNNMCMLMIIGFIMLTRLEFESALRQFEIAVIGLVLTLLVPLLIHRIKFFKKLTWVYAGVGIVLLGAVKVLGTTSYGAQLAINIGGISLQPSEFIKIIFVMFVASMLYESTEFKQVVKATVVAIIHVGILVLSTDLGAALIFFVAYLAMLYVATRKPKYIGAGLGVGVLAALISYKLFAHVRNRVIAWQDPLASYSGSGYQVSQSLFAIGTGGWLGLGLYNGMPESIPVVKQDFIFAAISEELGGVFALCLVLVCASCFLMFLNIAMQIKDQFYKLIALGLGTVYGFQVFLTIGGVTKCIPSTGVTLPLVSYGGSSLLSTLIIFAIIQGLYILRQDEGALHEVKKKKAGRKKPQDVRIESESEQPTTRKTTESKKRKRKGFETQFEDLD